MNKQLEFDFENTERFGSPLTENTLREALEYFEKTFLPKLSFDEDKDFKRDMWRLKYEERKENRPTAP